MIGQHDITQQCRQKCPSVAEHQGNKPTTLSNIRMTSCDISMVKKMDETMMGQKRHVVVVGWEVMIDT